MMNGKYTIFLILNSFFIFYNSNSVEIVELQQDEWEMYRDLRLKAVQEAPEAFGTTYEEELAVTMEDWKRRLNFNMIFAKSENRIIGMIGAVIDYRSKLNHVALVISFYVIPEFRNKGIGGLLLDNIINKLKKQKNIRKINLKVTTNQAAAVKLYKKNGFHINGVLENEYLINGIYYDQYIMTCSFQNDIELKNIKEIQKLFINEKWNNANEEYALLEARYS